MKDRRKEDRKSLMAYTQVFDLYGGYLLGYLEDLNLHGAMVIGVKPMNENSEVTISIDIPELPNINPTRMIIPVSVIWCQEDISPQYFNIGFQFKEIRSEQKSTIEAIIKNYEFRRDIPKYPPKPSIKL